MDFRREPRSNEAHDSTFGILENYHCWRFHGSGVIAALQIIGLIFFCTCMHHEHFLGRQCAFVFPIYVRKYTIDRWIVVYTVCASAVISPLRQWLDCYAKTRLKMRHTFKHFIHLQYFLLLTNLVIVFVHWVSTGVLYEPRECSLFWDYIPEYKLCFCLNLCHPSGPYIIRPIQKLLNCQTTTRGGWCNQKQRCGLWVHEMTWYLYTRGVRGRMKAKQRWFKVTPELCHEWFHVRHCVHDGHWTGELATVIWRLHCFTVSFRDVRGESGPRELASVNSLENSAMGTWPIYKNYYARLVRRMAWYKILIHVLIV